METISKIKQNTTKFPCDLRVLYIICSAAKSSGTGDDALIAFKEELKQHASYAPAYVELIAEDCQKNHDKIINNPEKLCIFKIFCSTTEVSSVVQKILLHSDSKDFVEPEHKTILLVRGGGTQESIDVFSDEKIVTAVSMSKTFIICGIGHSNDTSEVERVASDTAITPTEAGTLMARYVLKKKKFQAQNFGAKVFAYTIGFALCGFIWIFRAEISSLCISLLPFLR